MIPASTPSLRGPLRILYLTSAFWPEIGGVETVSRQLAAGLQRRGLEMTVVTASAAAPCARPPELAGVELHRVDLFGALRARDAAQLAAVRRAIAAVGRAARPHVVHVAFSPLTAYYTLGARLHGLAPVVLSFHGWWPEVGTAGDTGTRRAMDASAWITACSEATLRTVHALDPGVASRSSVVLNGIAQAGGAVPPPAPVAPVVVAAGRLSREKGFDVLLRAFADVRARYPEARLLLAGDGPERSALEAVARPLGGSVELVGWKTPREIDELLDRASVVAMPSRLEGFGVLAVEAALRGRPVVASSAGGLPEVVADGTTGLLVGVDDHRALADRICELLGDPDRAMRMGQAARQRARTLFGIDRYLDDHERLYHRLVSDDRRARALV